MRFTVDIGSCSFHRPTLTTDNILGIVANFALDDWPALTTDIDWPKLKVNNHEAQFLSLAVQGVFSALTIVSGCQC